MSSICACVQPDWDMFQSRHTAAHAHAAARAVSGAAVYVSDSPGQHDFGLLKKLVLPDGSVLRAQLPGRPTADCLFSDVLRDGKSLLKVGPLPLLLHTAWADTLPPLQLSCGEGENCAIVVLAAMQSCFASHHL